ncbi:lipopolysaccharide biosynthesis protein [Vibrio cyclitrophicus]
MFKRNTIANYCSQLYIAALNILLVPIYVDTLGIESYGIIGLYAMVQIWLQLLDLGLTPALSREAAKANNGSLLDKACYKKLHRRVSIFFFASSFILAAIGIILSPFVAEKLITKSLDLSTIEYCLTCISICVAFRWISNPYRSVLVGIEKQVQLAIVNFMVATLRLPGSLLVIYIYRDIESYFTFQIFVSILEPLVLSFLAKHTLNEAIPKVACLGKTEYSAYQSKVLKFALGISFTASAWVVISQTDKLLLSGLITVSEYGYYTMAVVAANMVTFIAQPFSQSLLPKLIAVESKSCQNEFVTEYINGTKFISALVIPCSLILAVYSKELVYIWSGDLETTRSVSGIVTWYSLGNLFLSLSAFAYYIQYVKGNIRLHIIGNIIYLLILVPGVYYFANHDGALGVAKFWLYHNFAYFIVWTAIVHKQFLAGCHLKWLIQGVLQFFPVSLLMILLAVKSDLISQDRLLGLFQFSLLGMMMLMINYYIYKYGIRTIVLMSFLKR